MRPNSYVRLGLLLVAAVIFATSCATTASIERSAPPVGAFVEVGGERLHVMDLGEAGAGSAPVVLIHGASVNLLDMKLALGDTLSKSHRVVLLDRPGRGYSSRPKDGWKIDRQAELIHAALENLGVERPVIVGQSLGGAVALAYALRYDEEITGLVLLAPVSHGWPGGVAWHNDVSGWPVLGFLFRRIVLPVYAPLAARESVERSFAPDIAPENYFDRAGVSLLFRPHDFAANADDIRRLKPQVAKQSERYGEIDAPTTIFTGLDDTTVSPQIHSMALVKAIPGASLILLPETGHALHHAESARIGAEITRLASPDARAAALQP